MKRLLRFQNKTIPVAQVHKMLWYRKHQSFALYDQQGNLIGAWQGNREWEEAKCEYDIIAAFVFGNDYSADFEVLVKIAAEPVIEDDFLVMSIKRDLVKELVECVS